MGAAGVGRESRAQGRIELRSLLFVFRLRPTGHGGLRGGCDGRISARGQALGAGEAVGVAEARQQAQLAHLHGGRSFFERGKNHADAFGRLRRTLGDCDERALGAREIFFVGLLPGPLQNGGLLGDGCDVVNSEIEHSVIMQSSRVIDIKRLEDSLIGREAEVIRSQKRPRALRLMIGDHCQIDTE